MTDEELTLRRQMVDTCRKMNSTGINQGTAGNLSVRFGDGFLITPSSLPYDTMQPEDLVEMGWDGTYVGRRPAARDLATHALRLEQFNLGFAGVPASRWLEEATHQTVVTDNGLTLAYDPALRDAFLAGMQAPTADLWPLFDACVGLPLALIRGANSDLLSAATATEMQRRRPDMLLATVPDRGHVPFLDEPESLTALHAFLKAVS